MSFYFQPVCVSLGRGCILNGPNSCAKTVPSNCKPQIQSRHSKDISIQKLESSFKTDPRMFFLFILDVVPDGQNFKNTQVNAQSLPHDCQDVGTSEREVHFSLMPAGISFVAGCFGHVWTRFPETTAKAKRVFDPKAALKSMGSIQSAARWEVLSVASSLLSDGRVFLLTSSATHSVKTCQRKPLFFLFLLIFERVLARL